ncbi:uncharacterized protein LOC141695627 [Apium graveolens]|uniref:uncharacterized protein LOC141695627 n=1 Tax=Apium graveolens TaxID=4045 RepID=UPI003D7AB415
MKIPILKKADYFTWRVKVLMFLEAIDDAYIDIINHGPPYPQKVVAMTPTVPEHYIRKKKSEWVIPCKTANYIWDALETQCHGTLTISKNRRVVLVQKYEQFDAKPDKTIIHIYDRFMTLLNDMSLVRNEYDMEDSNTKFLRDLPKEWDTQTSIIRHKYNLDLLSLDKVYGMLKTHDLEIQQRKSRKGQKMKVVSLNVEINKGKERVSGN